MSALLVASTISEDQLPARNGCKHSWRQGERLSSVRKEQDVKGPPRRRRHTHPIAVTYPSHYSTHIVASFRKGRNSGSSQTTTPWPITLSQATRLPTLSTLLVSGRTLKDEPLEHPTRANPKPYPGPYPNCDSESRQSVRKCLRTIFQELQSPDTLIFES